MISVLLSLFTASYLAGQIIDTDKQTSLTIDVTNRTANGTDTVNDEVFVIVFEQGKQKQTLKANVDAEGKAVFKNVPRGDDMTALPRVKHQNMMFNGHPVALKTGQTTFKGHVDVYEVSNDKSKLSVTVHHFIFDLKAGYLQITEYMRLNNGSDMAITSEEKDTNNQSKVVEVMLPEGFKNLTCLRYFQENDLVITKDGFYDTMAIPPGHYDTEFSYRLDINSETIDIIKKISLSTSQFLVFSLLNKGQLKGLGEPVGEVKLSDGSLAEYFSFPALKAGDQIKFQVVGFHVKKSNRNVVLTLSAVFAFIVLLVIRRLLSQKHN
jgi:hypothetical protein